MALPSRLQPARRKRAAIRLLEATVLCALVAGAQAGTHLWNSTTGNWSDAAKWTSGGVPSGADATDILSFGGAAATASYFSTNNQIANPFLLDQITLNSASTAPHAILGATPLRFGGANRTITQNGAGAFNLTAPLQAAGSLILAGAGTGQVTLSGSLQGGFNLVKDGASVFRLGSASGTTYADNRWLGTLTINAGPVGAGGNPAGFGNTGAIRFNNNAYSAPTALRSNPLVFTSSTASLSTQFRSTAPSSGTADPDSSLRFGTLNSSALLQGFIEARREDELFTTNGLYDSADIVLTTVSDGTYRGSIKNMGNAADANKDGGRFVIRGVGVQTLAGPSGSLQIEKDIFVGRSATVVLAEGVSLAATQTTGAIVLNGGTFKLDNSGFAEPNRLRDGTGTGLETIGGGKFIMGGSAGTNLNETIASLQLGSGSKPRSGALNISVEHLRSTDGFTNLTLAGLTRAGASVAQFATVDFAATGGVLGSTATNAPHILFTSAPPVSNGLLANSSGALEVGWATYQGNQFATYGASASQGGTGTGLSPVLATSFATAGAGATLNVQTTGSETISATGNYALNSLRLFPSAAGSSLTIGAGASLSVPGLLLAGSNDYTLTGAGTLAGSSTRYLHVQSATLTVAVPVTGSAQPLVKAGAGTLALTSSSNAAGAEFITAINQGILRGSQGSSLPTGEIRLRGGVLELSGGGTFARALGNGTNAINWSGYDSATMTNIGEDQGSGGFAAITSDVTIDFANVATVAWEGSSFLNSGHSLLFGSPSGNRRVIWNDNLNLSASSSVLNYNAREIRVEEHASAAVTTDGARIAGVISSQHLNASLQLVDNSNNDLLKSGPGTLELSAVNTYGGATLVHEGTLVVSGSIVASFLTDVRSGATLAGNGAAGDVRVETNGIFAPGDMAGRTSIFRTKDLTLAGTGARLALELGGTTAGGDGSTGYDQIQSAGLVTLTGGTLQLSVLPNFAGLQGDLLYLILNGGSDAVTGTFAGLAQGAIFQVGGVGFTITYTANGDGGAIGNDVALMVPEPSAGLLTLLGAGAAGLRRRRSVASTV